MTQASTTLVTPSVVSMRPEGAGCVQRASLQAARVLLIATVLFVVGATAHVRWSLAWSVPWQCDELPLIVRSTGICGHVSNEAEAAAFVPSLYTLRTGLSRSLRKPKYYTALHTTSAFWSNLSMHLLGCRPGAGRLMPFVFCLAASGVAGWMVWLVSRRLLATCLAVLLVALSPHANLYGLQIRGYGEALLLAPLLLVAMEYWRRRPACWWRGCLVLLLSLELGATVYTHWIYWSFPLLVLGCLWLPRCGVESGDRRVIQAGGALMLLGACMAMGFYTLERLDYLSYSASMFGATFGGVGDAIGFLSRWCQQLLGPLALLLVLAPLGVLAMWRTGPRWWLLAIVVGVGVPVAFAVVNGSMGYERNLGFLLVPLVALVALGADDMVRRMVVRFNRGLVMLAAAFVVAGVSTWSFAGLQGRVRSMLLPDWGAMVCQLDREPETIGPRWLCADLANHWQINWYHSTRDADRFFDMPIGGRVEVVLGAQLDAEGHQIVYRHHPHNRGIVGEPLPAYLGAAEPAGVAYGIALRRWSATRLDPVEAAKWGASVPRMLDPSGGRAHAPGEAGVDNADSMTVDGVGGGIGSVVAAVDPRAGAREAVGHQMAADQAEGYQTAADKAMGHRMAEDRVKGQGSPVWGAAEQDRPILVLVRRTERCPAFDWSRVEESELLFASGAVTFYPATDSGGVTCSLIAPSSAMPLVLGLIREALSIPDGMSIPAESLAFFEPTAPILRSGRFGVSYSCTVNQSGRGAAR